MCASAPAAVTRPLPWKTAYACGRLRSCTETMTRGSRRMLSGLRRPSAVLHSSSLPSTSIQTIVSSGLPRALNVFDLVPGFDAKLCAGDLRHRLWRLRTRQTRTLLSGSTRNEPNKLTQLAKRTLIKVGGSSQYWFHLLTVISKMQSVLEFNDVRSVSVIRLDRRYDTQAPPIRRAPSPSYAGSAPNSDVDHGVLIQHLLTF